MKFLYLEEAQAFEVVKCEETNLETLEKSLEFFKWIHLLEFLYGIFISVFGW